MPDCWVESERVLAGTSAALAGPVVASMGVRHPATVAGALRTLEDHHPGRVFAVVGRGESSVHNEGLPVPSLRSHTDHLRTLRDRLQDGDGSDGLPGRLLGAASGPRTITATADALGGVLLDVGTEVGTVRRAVALARADHPETQVWLFVRALVVNDPRDAAPAAAPLLGSCAARMVAAPAWFGLDRGAAVPRPTGRGSTRLPPTRCRARHHRRRRRGGPDGARPVPARRSGQRGHSADLVARRARHRRRRRRRGTARRGPRAAGARGRPPEPVSPTPSRPRRLDDGDPRPHDDSAPQSLLSPRRHGSTRCPLR